MPLKPIVEVEDGPIPELARFHVLEDGTLLILGQFSGLGPTPIYRCALVSDELD